MLQNVGQFIPEGQLLFIATDERNKSFFDAFHSRFPRIRYLDDFMDYAELREINPNFLGALVSVVGWWYTQLLTALLLLPGMIDQVVCTRGQIFVGTWFSTFTGYITRMRGYLGYPDSSVYFGDMAHRYQISAAGYSALTSSGTNRCSRLYTSVCVGHQEKFLLCDYVDYCGTLVYAHICVVSLLHCYYLQGPLPETRAAQVPVLHARVEHLLVPDRRVIATGLWKAAGYRAGGRH